MYCIQAVVCRLYEMFYPCICNVVISCWKSRAYGFVICRGGTDMCFVPGSGWKHLDLEQYRISGLTRGKPRDHAMIMWNDWLCISCNAIVMHDVYLLCFVICLMIYYAL